MTVLCESPSRIVRCSKYIGRASGTPGACPPGAVTASGTAAPASSAPNAAHRAKARNVRRKRISKPRSVGSRSHFALAEVVTPRVAVAPRVAITPGVAVAPCISAAPRVTVAPAELPRVGIRAVPEEAIERRREPHDEIAENRKASEQAAEQGSEGPTRGPLHFHDVEIAVRVLVRAATVVLDAGEVEPDVQPDIRATRSGAVHGIVCVHEPGALLEHGVRERAIRL